MVRRQNAVIFGERDRSVIRIVLLLAWTDTHRDRQTDQLVDTLKTVPPSLSV